MANIVETTLCWADGRVTTKIIDMDNSAMRRRFSKLAYRCIKQNGTSKVVGKNPQNETHTVVTVEPAKGGA